jgi:actin-like ATPase involved in cell morphogenesis
MSDIDDILDLDKKTENKKTEIKKENEFLPGCGVDIGTSNIVVARRTKDGKFINRFHRNMLYPLDISEEAMDLLEKSSYLYVKVGDKYFVVGEDALTLVNAIGKGEVVRPMQDGILNPSLQESSELLFYIIKAVVGDPIVENETLRFSVPADPVDANINNKFHEMILGNLFKKMGYDAKPVNEAMCICYDCNPVMKEDDDENVPLSGISLSAGGGMTNIALSYKGLSLQEFSVTKSGDYIDEQAAIMTGSKKSKVIKVKEKSLDLNKFDINDRIQSALVVYYGEMIDRMIHYASNKFKGLNSEVDGEIEIVVAGGTSMAPGFCQKLQEAINNENFPFKVYRVRHSETPFYSVSQGACIRAQADYNKKQK